MRRYQEVAAVVNTGGFPVVKLGDIVEFKNGKNIPERDRNETGTYPYYASNGISGFVEKSIFEGPSVLLGDQGSAWHKSHHFVENGVKFYAGNHTIVMKPKNTSLDIKYLYYHLLLNDLQNFNKCAALIPELDKERFYSSNMILPPLPIQQEIVTALDLIYNNAATAKATVASVKSQMASVMRSVCARGFERKHIKDVMNVVSGKANQDREAGRPVPYYDSNGVIGYVAEPLYTGEYTITARNLSIGAVHYINGPFYPSDHTINFSSLDQNVMNNQFFYNWLHLNNQVLKDLSSGIKPGIRKSDVAEILMPIPPIEFQHEILAILNEMEAELVTLEQMVAKAEQRAKFILDGYTC
jgi:type I restriction enzyme S subunit